MKLWKCKNSYTSIQRQCVDVRMRNMRDFPTQMSLTLCVCCKMCFCLIIYCFFSLFRLDIFFHKNNENIGKIKRFIYCKIL